MLKVALFLSLVVALACAQYNFPGQYDPNAYVQSKCEAYGQVPQSCTDFVDPNIWVPTNYTQSRIQQEVADYATIDTIVANIPTPECKASFLKIVCSSAFRRCYNTTVGYNTTFVEITFGRPVCKSDCVQAVSDCRSYFEAAGQSQYLPNCSYEVQGYPVYPDVALTLDVYNQTVTLQCFHPPGTSNLCIDSGLFTICAGSTMTSPFRALFSLFFEESTLSLFNWYMSGWLSVFEGLF